MPSTVVRDHVAPVDHNDASRFPRGGTAPADPARVRAAVDGPLPFGSVFTDSMVTMRWRHDVGWHDGQLGPYRPLVLPPTAIGLHYGQTIFEGLKAYRLADGGVALFRPEMNARRFDRSAARLAMPALPEGALVEAVRAIVDADADWVPEGDGQSLYVRPFMIATEAYLGVRPSREYLFAVVASPVDPYFSAEVRPLSVWVCEDHSRAAPGGTGEAKCGGNYAAGLVAQGEAAAHGCDQVVWLDAVERRWVEEMGAMNLCWVWDRGGRPVIGTSPLTGTLLPGVVRDSLLTLAADLGYGVEEAPLDVDDWRSACATGALREVFAAGTAAVIAPVGQVHSKRGSWMVGDGQPGPTTMRLRAALLDLQRGVAPDPHGWLERVR